MDTLFITHEDVRNNMSKLLIILLEDVAQFGENQVRDTLDLAKDTFGVWDDREVVLHAGAEELIEKKRSEMSLRMRSETITIAARMMEEYTDFLIKHDMRS